MAITTEILRSYRAPRDVLRRQLDDGTREDRALVYLYAACLLIFVSSLPKLARDAHFDPSVPLDARVGGALLSWMFVVPLLSYVLAGVSHIIAKPLGGKGSWFSSRLALFWSLLAAAPLWLLNGLVGGMVGQGPAQQVVAAISLVAFFAIWLSCLREAESAPEG